MPSLKAIRNRIRSVKSTQQITRAMKMVAAAKLRRSQESVLSARPYAQKMEEMLRGVAQRVDLASHPLLQKRPVKNVELVVLTSDRGLCGGFNSNIVRRAQRFIAENGGTFDNISLRTVGRKGYEFFKQRAEIRKDYPGLYQKLNYGAAQSLALELSQSFLNGDADAIFIVYNEFVSAVSQRTRLTQLLPIEAPSETELARYGGSNEYIFEPSSENVLHALLPRYFASAVWRSLLESVAAEQGARMSAMDNATNNATDMINRLTLQYNRTRQAGITKELMEIVSGAEAQK